MLSDKTRLTAADQKLFERLGIPTASLERCGVRRVTHSAAWKIGFRAGTGQSMDGILFPYFGAAGNFVNGRIRLDNPEIVRGKTKRKYLTLSAKLARRLPYFVLGAGREKLTAELEAVGLVESGTGCAGANRSGGAGRKKSYFRGDGRLLGRVGAAKWQGRSQHSAPGTGTDKGIPSATAARRQPVRQLTSETGGD